MAFDPAKSADHLPNSAAEMRAQLTALKALKALKALFDAEAAQIADLQTQLATTTSSNSNAVANLGLVITTNPVELFQVQPIGDKVDELINALRR